MKNESGVRTIEEKTKGLIEGIRRDLVGMSYSRLGQDLYGIVQSQIKSGTINLWAPEIQTIITAVLYADPNSEREQALKKQGKGGAIMSFVVVKQESEEKIKQLISEGAKEEDFEAIRRDRDNFIQDLESKGKNAEGVKKILATYISELQLRNAVSSAALWGNIDKTGTRNFLSMDQQIELIKKTLPEVKLPPEVTARMVENKEFLKKITNSTKQKMIEFFAVKGMVQDNVEGYIFDKSKFTDEQIKKFGEAVSADAAAFLIIQKAIEKMEEKGSKVSPELADKIANNLRPSLSKLGSEYLTAHSPELVAELSNSLQSKKQVTTKSLKSVMQSLVGKDFTISTESLTGIANKMVGEHSRVKSLPTKLGPQEVVKEPEQKRKSQPVEQSQPIVNVDAKKQEPEKKPQKKVQETKPTIKEAMGNLKQHRELPPLPEKKAPLKVKEIGRQESHPLPDVKVKQEAIQATFTYIEQAISEKKKGYLATVQLDLKDLMNSVKDLKQYGDTKIIYRGKELGIADAIKQVQSDMKSPGIQMGKKQAPPTPPRRQNTLHVDNPKKQDQKEQPMQPEHGLKNH
jgi:hypothetical protein